jgi:hypothetical protein
MPAKLLPTPYMVSCYSVNIIHIVLDVDHQFQHVADEVSLQQKHVVRAGSHTALATDRATADDGNGCHSNFKCADWDCLWPPALDQEQ